ncbi:MAG: hypothetical protein ACJAVM_002845 [Sulfitobacter sp.]|jgi:hypothetical protein
MQSGINAIQTVSRVYAGADRSRDPLFGCDPAGHGHIRRIAQTRHEAAAGSDNKSDDPGRKPVALVAGFNVCIDTA